jgi:methionine synthase II (cobalamin-independent)
VKRSSERILTTHCGRLPEPAVIDAFRGARSSGDLLPEGKILIPGVVGHATSNLVEGPEVVADRILRYVELVGRENVIAGTDCGLGGRCHPDVVWAKLRALSDGAALASQQLWR